MLLAFAESNKQDRNIHAIVRAPEHKQETTMDRPSPNSSTHTKPSFLRIAIGTSVQQYEIEKLLQLSYFDAMLAGWKENVDRTKSIQILKNASSNNSNDAMNQCNSHSNQFNFDCGDLNLLLKCVEQNKIPTSLPLVLENIEGS